MRKPASFPINIAAAFGAFSLISMSSAVLVPAHAERIVEEITRELTYLGTDLKKREKEYAKRMDYAIHDIVTKDFEEMEDDAQKALKAAQKEWGPEHVNTLMAVAMTQLARANAMLFYGGSDAEVQLMINHARIFALVYPEFAGSYYVETLADITKARLVSVGDETLAKEFYDKALAAMAEEPTLSNRYRMQFERDFLM